MFRCLADLVVLGITWWVLGFGCGSGVRWHSGDFRVGCLVGICGLPCGGFSGF